MSRGYALKLRVGTLQTPVICCIKIYYFYSYIYVVAEWYINGVILFYGSVGLYHRTVEPRNFFFTVPVPSMSRYYRGTAIPLIPHTVPANK